MEELLENARSFWKSAELVFSAKDYTSATILYFKCLFALFDIIIFKAQRRTPKDHTERFRILQSRFPELYTVLDKIFQIYRDTYSLNIEKQKCEEVRKHVIRIADEQEIHLGNQ